ncbi:tol-pal system-associated acyl-CoA thioesterase [Albimonas pacifica]|uniref:Acyl-CoA thioester hydrolase n=1 Tax=Albimonas pacifica TaxID=1114924 RepID=A0A1I3E2W0_9RHOB|nr:tol-pal system-associated acyl-CoA thioesterase [Albimonas pacifica]SFH93314.1 acyl-CoA thioester hydrolase [Albimonas pacifica]
MTEHRLTVRVYYEDTDLAGVVFYANYLRYYERGRSDALRELGVDQSALKAAGVVFVVRRIEVDYVAPARFEDLLEVVTRVETLKGASAVMGQEIRRDGLTLNRARVSVACMTLDGRPVRLPPEARAAMERLAG